MLSGRSWKLSLPNSPLISSDLRINNLWVLRLSQDTPFSIHQWIQPDLGCICEACKVRFTLPATINVQDVQSHMDDTTFSFNSLLSSAHLNIFAPSSTYWSNIDCPNPTKPHDYYPTLKQSWYSMKTESHPNAHTGLTDTLQPIMCDNFPGKFGWDTPVFFPTLTGFHQSMNINISPQPAA